MASQCLFPESKEVIDKTPMETFVTAVALGVRGEVLQPGRLAAADLTRWRMHRAGRLLASHRRINEIALDVGYGTEGAFAKPSSVLGLTPSGYRPEPYSLPNLAGR
jgi:AraC-like DNA-binding protein